MNPYRIAVCEDDPHDQEQLKSLLRGIFAASESEDGGAGPEPSGAEPVPAEPEVVCFSTAEALRAAEESGEEFGVFLLDIQMPGESGLDLAREAVRPQTVQFQRGGRTVSLPVDRIRFLESRDHGVAVYLEQEERFFSMPLAEAERLLPAGMFARCHKSYLVSLAWVEECGRTEVRLRDGARLPASRTFYRDFQSALVRWLNHSAP